MRIDSSALSSRSLVTVRSEPDNLPIVGQGFRIKESRRRGWIGLRGFCKRGGVKWVWKSYDVNSEPWLLPAHGKLKYDLHQCFQ